MIRLTVLTVALTLAGAPLATTACLIWCGSPCPPAGTGASEAISATMANCDDLLVTAPSLREDSQRDRANLSLAHSAVPTARMAHADLEHSGVSFEMLREHAPPGHQKPRTVLRL